MITTAAICLVLSFFAAILWPTPEPGLVLLGIAVLMAAARFLP
jgi:hypothetical protein